MVKNMIKSDDMKDLMPMVAKAIKLLKVKKVNENVGRFAGYSNQRLVDLLEYYESEQYATSDEANSVQVLGGKLTYSDEHRDAIRECNRRTRTVVNEEALERADAGMGMVQMWNDNVAIVGGLRSGGSSAGLTRLKYVLYDIKGANEKGIEPQDNEVGFVELYVEDGSGNIEGLVNIKLDPKNRRGGLGREIIQSLIESPFVNRPFKVYDIKKGAVPFWRKMGVEFTAMDFKTPVTNPSKRTGGLFGVIK